MVTFGLNSSRNVVFSPSNMSRSRKRSVHFGFGYSTSMRNHLGLRTEQEEQRERDDDHAGNGEGDLAAVARQREDDDAGDEYVGQRQRNHPLPPELHELIETKAREGRAEPDVHHHEDHDLDEEDHRTEDPAPDAHGLQRGGGQSIAADR